MNAYGIFIDLVLIEHGYLPLSKSVINYSTRGLGLWEKIALKHSRKIREGARGQEGKRTLLITSTESVYLSTVLRQ